MSKLFLLLNSLFLMGFVYFGINPSEVEGLPALSTLIVPVIIIIVLVLLNGLFVASEFAIIGVRPSQIEQMVDEGNKRAVGILAILENSEKQDEYIATAQLGITIASLGLGMYGEPQLAHFIEPYLGLWLPEEWLVSGVIHTIAYVLSLSLLTYLHIVIGEMVPKTIALSSAEKVVFSVSPAMNFFKTILGWPVYILNKIGNSLLRLFKIPPASGHARLHSPEELELIVSESAGEGLLNQDEEEMILNIFDFSQRQVGQVMSPRPKIEAIPYDMPHDELVNFVAASSHSRFPVYTNDLDHIIGILHLKDLVGQEVDKKRTFDLRLLLRPAPAVSETTLVVQLLAAFKKQRIHMAQVLDEFGGLAGIVTLEDLVEEIVGEVQDEFDNEKEPIVEVSPGVLDVAGDYLIDDLTDYLFLGEEGSLPDVETVGGLIVTQLGRPPRIGDRVFYGDVQLLVLDVDRLAVARVEIQYPVPGQEKEDNSTVSNSNNNH